MGWKRRAASVLGSAVLLVAPLAAPAEAAPHGIAPVVACSAQFYHGDRRLGPEQVPTTGPVGWQLIGYRRTGYLPERQFLESFYDQGTGSWRYPPLDGYLIGPDGQPIEFELTLVAGAHLDRYGGEYGGFLAPQGLPYASRSIPPSSLDAMPAGGCNYHVYQVLRPFTVDAGPIAPWFAQPGGGLQYQLDGDLVAGAPAQLNVRWMIDNGYLARLR